MIFEGLKNDDVAELCCEAFRSARESRNQIAERKKRDYQLYRRFRAELGAMGGKDSTDKGPGGWSKMTMPLSFWIVETILPRVGINPPKPIITARKPAGAMFAQGKQLRLEELQRRAAMDFELLIAFKQFLIYGDGPGKTRWDPVIGGPSFRSINWFDYFVSPDAQRYDDGEWIFHRTWWTPSDFDELARHDKNRKNGEPSQYDHEVLQQIRDGGGDKASVDPEFAEIREASGLGQATWSDGRHPTAVIECWHRDGSMALISEELQVAARIEREALHYVPGELVDPAQPHLGFEKKVPYRPFVTFQNTPDLLLPYGISDVEMIEDHQHEGSTFRNQAIDQGTRNLRQPLVFDESKISATEIAKLYSRPGGMHGVRGDPNNAIMQIGGGAMTADLERVNNMIVEEAQRITGVNDVTQGIAASSDQTATEIASLREEANMRFRFKLKLIQIGARKMAQQFDALDRRMNPHPVYLKLPSGFTQAPNAQGIEILDSGYARINPVVNSPGEEFEIDVDAGTMAPPNQWDQALKMKALIADLVQVDPNGQMVNVPELIRMLVESHGFDPQRVLSQVPAQAPGQDAPAPGEEDAPPPEELPPDATVVSEEELPDDELEPA